MGELPHFLLLLVSVFFFPLSLSSCIARSTIYLVTILSANRREPRNGRQPLDPWWKQQLPAVSESLQFPASVALVPSIAVSALALPTIPLYLPATESSVWLHRPCRCRHPSPLHRPRLASQPGTQTAKTPPHQHWREACRPFRGLRCPTRKDLSAPVSLSSRQFPSTSSFSSFRGLVYWTADDYQRHL